MGAKFHEKPNFPLELNVAVLNFMILCGNK